MYNCWRSILKTLWDLVTLSAVMPNVTQIDVIHSFHYKFKLSETVDFFAVDIT